MRRAPPLCGLAAVVALTAVGLSTVWRNDSAPTVIAKRSEPAQPNVVHPRDIHRCAAGGRLGTFSDFGGLGLPPGMNPARFDLTTIWIRTRPQLLEVAYGGAALIPRRRAGVSLLLIRPERGSGFYALPRIAARLTITCVRGGVLAFRYDGGRGTFSLSSHRWELRT
jgi:hypothetical protein